MTLAAITACLYPDTRMIHLLMDSAVRHGVPLTPYGIGDNPSDWGHIKVTRLLPVIEELLEEGYTHVLYTDGTDSLFVRPWEDVQSEYLSLDSPLCLMSAETDCYPFRELGDQFPARGPWRYPCAGQYMGEIPWILERWSAMARDYASHPERNDQGWITLEILAGRMEGLVLDSECRIFQSMSGDGVEKRDGVINTVTGSRPCVLHFNGGYSDPVTGRDERMMPWV